MDITKLDPIERFFWDARHCVSCLGNADTGEFLLIPADREPILTEGELMNVRLRGFYYCGVFGIVSGVALYQCEPGFSAWLEDPRK
jgi:hypothetical protein